MPRDRSTGRKSILITAIAATLAVAAGVDAGAAEARARRPPPTDQGSGEASEATDVKMSAATRAERLAARKPHDRGARLEAARAQLAEGADDAQRVEAAHAHATAVLAEHPADTDALLLAGQTSLLQGDAAKALRYYRAATLADAKNASAHLGLGDALTRLGDEPGASAAFARYRQLMGMPALTPAEQRD